MTMLLWHHLFLRVGSASRVSGIGVHYVGVVHERCDPLRYLTFRSRRPCGLSLIVDLNESFILANTSSNFVAWDLDVNRLFVLNVVS